MPQDVVPRLALIYAITMQTRNPELSLLQRVVASCLADNISDQKVWLINSENINFSAISWHQFVL